MTTTCKFFNQPGGCRNGNNCTFEHASRRTKLLPMCPIFRSGKKCVNFRTCKFRHHATKKEHAAVVAEQKVHRRQQLKKSLIAKEETKFAIVNGYGKHWRTEMLMIRHTVDRILPDELLQLIGEYHFSEVSSINWSPIINTNPFFAGHYTYNEEDDLSKCSHCDRKCNDVWIVIYQHALLFDGDSRHFSYQKCCGNCVRFDFEANVDSISESRAILVTDKWNPIINWNKPIDMKWNVGRAIPKNDRTRACSFGIDESCWVIPANLFRDSLRGYAMSLHTLLWAYQPTKGESLVQRYIL